MLKVIQSNVKYLDHGFSKSMQFVGGTLRYCEFWLEEKMSLKSQIFLFYITLLHWSGNTIYIHQYFKITVVILIKKIPLIAILLSTDSCAIKPAIYWATLSLAVIWPQNTLILSSPLLTQTKLICSIAHWQSFVNQYVEES